MKHLSSLIIPALLMLCGCANTGFNKPITEVLSDEEILANTKKYPFFEKEYKYWETRREWMLEDYSRTEKYGGLTYGDLIKGVQKLPSDEELEKEHEALFPQRETLREKADSLIEYYSGICPDSLVSLEFISIRNYRTIFGRSSEFSFLAKPSKEGVEQFRFDFGFAPKIDGIKKLRDVPKLYRGFGKVTKPLNKEQMVSGSPYIGFTETKEELKRDFDFFYEITDARFCGKNWRDVPGIVEFAITQKPCSPILLDDVVEECIDKDYLPLRRFMNKERNRVLHQYNPLVADFLNYYFDDED